MKHRKMKIIDEQNQRQQKTLKSYLSPIDKIKCLMNDCTEKRCQNKQQQKEDRMRSRKK